jgi:hypothetical protein
MRLTRPKVVYLLLSGHCRDGTHVEGVFSTLDKADKEAFALMKGFGGVSSWRKIDVGEAVPPQLHYAHYEYGWLLVKEWVVQ